MDNNNPTPAPTQAPAAPVVPQVPPMPPVAPNVVPASNSGSNKIILWFVIGLVVVILIVGGIYFFLSSQQQPTTNQPVQPVTVVPSPSPENLENSINNVNVEASPSAIDNTLAPVNQDLQQL